MGNGRDSMGEGCQIKRSGWENNLPDRINKGDNVVSLSS